MDHDGVGSRPRVMEQVLTMNVIPQRMKATTKQISHQPHLSGRNCRDGIPTKKAMRQIDQLTSESLKDDF